MKKSTKFLLRRESKINGPKCIDFVFEAVLSVVANVLIIMVYLMTK